MRTGNGGSIKKPFFAAVLCINFLSLSLSIIYISKPEPNAVWNICGLFLLAALLLNLGLVQTSGRFRGLDYFYLLYFQICMLAVPLFNTLSSLKVTDRFSRSAAGIGLLLSVLLFGCVIAAGRLFLPDTFDGLYGARASRKSSIPKRILKTAVIILLVIIQIGGFYIFYDLLARNTGEVMEVFLPEYSLFYGLFFLGVAALSAKLLWRVRRTIFKPVSAAAGLLIFAVCALPFASVPFFLSKADAGYIQTFGGQWKSVDPMDQKYFMSIPFSIPNYFFGTLTGGYNLNENILYYEGRDGADKGIKLYFDAYMPAGDKSVLPGRGAVLIRIHGGAWNIGDKGSSNFAQVSKYFASQGYVVFDIQYGLNNKDKFVDFVKVPDNVRGSFSIDDMVRHIGIFTKYLADHADEYGADLNNVFVSGGSAGGQLTVATALGASSGKHADIFDPRLKIRGLIPFYPADGLSRIGGTDDFINPEGLVSRDSPPCLIYQGDRDGIVDPEIAARLKTAYTKNNNKNCALLSMPFGSHGSDYYFSGYYNQVFMYYMERFMYHAAVHDR